MGVTFASPMRSIDITYSGMARLRCCIVHMISAEFCAQYAAFFDHQCDGETDAVTARLNDMIAEYELAHGDECDPVFEFLFASDADGILDCAGCDALKKLISADPQKHSELESLRIGYEGWAHPATGADFMRLLDESAEAQTALTWY